MPSLPKRKFKLSDSDIGNLRALSHKEIQLATHIEEKYRPIAEAVGLIAMDWNSIHNRLGRIFARVTGLGEDVAYAIWNSIENDRIKRKILKNAAIAVYNDELQYEAKINIIQLIYSIDKFSAKRNSSIHCPFTILMENGEMKIIPDHFVQNKHAEKLKDLDILTELQGRIHELEVLDLRTQYVLQCLKIVNLGEPWPSPASPS